MSTENKKKKGKTPNQKLFSLLLVGSQPKGNFQNICLYKCGFSRILCLSNIASANQIEFTLQKMNIGLENANYAYPKYIGDLVQGDIKGEIREVS